MSQKSREDLRRFKQRMRNEGADGFADGPRPWESWDESGHQANNRIWEGSARRLYPGKGAPHSFGYRLLSFLAFIALATLLVGIGGVYFSHTQTQQLVQTGVQPLPVTDRPRPAITAAGTGTVIATASPEMNDLNVMTATAAGVEAIQEQAAAAAETATTAALDSPPVTDEPTAEATVTVPPAAASVTTAPVTSGTIDSVAIETIVTRQSVTTTVYTRHPQQDKAEVVAAIETTPPPFAHEIVAAPQEASDTPSSTLTAAATEIPTDPITALSILPPPAAHAAIPAVAEGDGASDPDAAPLHGERYDTTPDELSGDATTVAAAEMNSETTVTESVAEVEPEITGDHRAEQTGNTTPVAAAVMSSKADEPEITGDHHDAVPDMPLVEQAEEATTVALAETGSVTADRGPAAEAAVEDTAAQQIAPVQAVTAVAKTGDWVINLASYTWKSTASKKLALFQQQGVDAEIFAVSINDKPMYRVRITGFESSRQAKAEIPAVEQKLNLEGAWISKR